MSTRSGSHRCKSQVQQPSDRDQVVARRVSKVGRGERDIYLSLHQKSYISAQGGENSRVLALRGRKNSNKNKAFVLFKHWG